MHGVFDTLSARHVRALCSRQRNSSAPAPRLLTSRCAQTQDGVAERVLMPRTASSAPKTKMIRLPGPAISCKAQPRSLLLLPYEKEPGSAVALGCAVICDKKLTRVGSGKFEHEKGASLLELRPGHAVEWAGQEQDTQWAILDLHDPTRVSGKAEQIFVAIFELPLSHGRSVRVCIAQDCAPNAAPTTLFQ